MTRSARPARPALTVGLTILLCLAVSLGLYYGGLDALLVAAHSKLRLNRRTATEVLAFWSLVVVLVVAAVANWRVRRAAVAFLGFSLVLSLALLELGVRLVHPKHGYLDEEYWHDRQFHHRLPPSHTLASWEHKGRVRREPALIVTNEDGFRTAYTATSFAAHKTRIAFLGDSFTQGFGVAEDAGVVHGVEAALQQRFPDADIAVVNAGNTSYSPLLEEIRYRKVLRAYHPQWVVLMLDETDFGDDAVYESEATPSPDGPTFSFDDFQPKGKWPGPSDHVALLQRLSGPTRTAIISPLAGLLRRVDNQGNLPTHKAKSGALQPTRFFMYRQTRAQNVPFYERTMGYLQRIADEVKQDGGQFVVVFVPRYPHWSRTESPHNWEAAEYRPAPNLDDDVKYLAEQKTKVSYDLFDLLPAFAEAVARPDAQPLCFEDDPHWNERGNAVAAAAIAEHLAARLKPQP